MSTAVTRWPVRHGLARDVPSETPRGWRACPLVTRGLRLCDVTRCARGPRSHDGRVPVGHAGKRTKRRGRLSTRASSSRSSRASWRVIRRPSPLLATAPPCIGARAVPPCRCWSKCHRVVRWPTSGADQRASTPGVLVASRGGPPIDRSRGDDRAFRRFRVTNPVQNMGIRSRQLVHNRLLTGG